MTLAAPVDQRGRPGYSVPGLLACTGWFLGQNRGLRHLHSLIQSMPSHQRGQPPPSVLGTGSRMEEGKKME